jgi:2,3-bisphosphoglycerate-independent phosphoglycerate mutase
MFHCFLDGRDTPPRSGKGYVETLENTMREENLGRIAMVSGRYWAMDRDKRWDRVKRAYDAMVRNEADHRASSGVDAVQQGYDRNENDEFVAPTLINDASGQPVGRIRTGDQALFFNFRPDRARDRARLRGRHVRRFRTRRNPEDRTDHHDPGTNRA